ncbi:MAG: GNAT family N-acetyltransferase, partial [Candidatus Eisenbacteria bacterium]|nr:GNAT family N-acetyltransferase [Candidatus Eisenbacteria bacterium]
NTRAEEMASWGWSEAQQTAFLNHQHTMRENQYQSLYKEALHQLILLEDKPVGRRLVGFTDTEITLVDIALLSEHRGKGIGSQLIRELQDRAESEGKALILSVTAENRARILYERLGFLVTKDGGMYLSMRWEPE